MYWGTELPACWRLDNLLLSGLLYAIFLENIKSNSYFFRIIAVVEDLLDFACSGVVEGWKLTWERDCQCAFGLGQTGDVKLNNACGIQDGFPHTFLFFPCQPIQTPNFFCPVRRDAPLPCFHQEKVSTRDVELLSHFLGRFPMCWPKVFQKVSKWCCDVDHLSSSYC